MRLIPEGHSDLELSALIFAGSGDVYMLRQEQGFARRIS
jgi:hypothetical protein